MDWKKYGIPDELAALDAAAMKKCAGAFRAVENIRDDNQLKVLNAFTACRVGAEHLQGSTGYGYSDIGRDKLDEVCAAIFGAEDALCRTQFMSGTHAITVALFGLLRQGMTMLSVAGTPYDTLRTALGIKGAGMGSLPEFGVCYEQIELKDGVPDLELIVARARTADVVYIQRSRGYSARKALTLAEIGDISKVAKAANPDAVVVVDNCYGEFTQREEPLAFGADIIIGSMIKNPGGGIAETGGYIAGRGDLVERCANRLTAPGVGREIGCNPMGYRSMFLGLYMAPQITAEALKSAIYSAALFETLGFKTAPAFDAPRDDIITTVELGSAENLESLCGAIQANSPIDSYAVPEGDAMPGYDSKVIMASGAFANGSSIELSADAPMEPPYRAYVQGGLNLISSRYALLQAAKRMTEGR